MANCSNDSYVPIYISAKDRGVIQRRTDRRKFSPESLCHTKQLVIFCRGEQDLKAAIQQKTDYNAIRWVVCKVVITLKQTGIPVYVPGYGKRLDMWGKFGSISPLPHTRNSLSQLKVSVVIVLRPEIADLIWYFCNGAAIPQRNHGYCPARPKGGSLLCRCFLLAPFTGNEEGKMVRR